MLNIIHSKTREKILKLLFLHEDKVFYLSQIAKAINTSKGNAQRELNKLIEADIVNTKKESNRRYYNLKRDTPVFVNLKSIINKTIGLEAEIRKLIRKIEGLQFAFIFGSYVKGNFTSDSDLDLFLIGRIDEATLIEFINKAEKKIDREINYHLYDLNDFRIKIKKDSFLKNITQKYLLLTDNENEFRKLL